jgi:membrane protein implicated in regulation of membrane protease activity
MNMKIHHRHSHLIFGIIQSGITSAIASAVATFSSGSSLVHWAGSWAVAWITMLPIVIFAAPVIKRLVDKLVHAPSR